MPSKISFLLPHSTSNLSTNPVVFSFKIYLEPDHLPPSVPPRPQHSAGSWQQLPDYSFPNQALFSLFSNPMARILSLNHNRRVSLFFSKLSNGSSYPRQNISLYRVLKGPPWSDLLPASPLCLPLLQAHWQGCLSLIILDITHLSEGLCACSFLSEKLS